MASLCFSAPWRPTSRLCSSIDSRFDVTTRRRSSSLACSRSRRRRRSTTYVYAYRQLVPNLRFPDRISHPWRALRSRIGPSRARLLRNVRAECTRMSWTRRAHPPVRTRLQPSALPVYAQRMYPRKRRLIVCCSLAHERKLRKLPPNDVQHP